MAVCLPWTQAIQVRFLAGALFSFLPILFGVVVYGLASGVLVPWNQVRVLATPSLLGAMVAYLAVDEATSDQYR